MSPRLGPYSGKPTGVPGGNGRRPEELQPGLRNHFVYWMHASDGEVLYVGCTRLPEQRWRDHKKSRDALTSQVARCRMAGPYDYPTARRIERAQLFDHRPRFNVNIPVTRTREETGWLKYSAPTYIDAAGASL